MGGRIGISKVKFAWIAANEKQILLALHIPQRQMESQPEAANKPIVLRKCQPRAFNLYIKIFN
ncbi:MAG TPA: hypothetical protein P5176_06565 [Methanothrix sp.]|jgi:hypothetical protein|uniref:hypothetical protein n=1 Tax=Methanothrix soehngenii TaxID=2223 RepID=UPI00064F7ECF|nr:hypothetical protein [Methanothrix soehngenii]MBP7068328.1 hypothetical protein [Methanothrix sp.]HPL21425.1 hypothetical protein [Methanothrix soehngenii]HRW32454.1 hypothetical protein [Methanothrix sp.]